MPNDNQALTILGIETSCDETAAAVVRREGDGSGRILSNVVFSQIAEHQPYGGVVPEIAARAHVQYLDGLIVQALEEAFPGKGCGDALAQINGIAATAGPGLIGGVMVGLMTAKGIALARGLPLVAVNHLEGHALSVRLVEAVSFPYLVLLVSGGHTQLVVAKGVGQYALYGTTLDDAAGEAFDKVAKLLGLGYPGGPAIEARAMEGDPTRFDFPRPLRGREGCDFSFSGLKTAVWHAAKGLDAMGEHDVSDIAASFQAAVADVLADRVGHALPRFASEYSEPEGGYRLVVAGGVAANAALKLRLAEVAAVQGFQLVAPPLSLCNDNGAMIAWAGAERLMSGKPDSLETPPRARWPLADIS